MHRSDFVEAVWRRPTQGYWQRLAEGVKASRRCQAGIRGKDLRRDGLPQDLPRKLCPGTSTTSQPHLKICFGRTPNFVVEGLTKVVGKRCRRRGSTVLKTLFLRLTDFFNPNLWKQPLLKHARTSAETLKANVVIQTLTNIADTSRGDRWTQPTP
eukprot:1141301-Pelagomonas_calceolata.AAC.6